MFLDNYVCSQNHQSKQCHKVLMTNVIYCDSFITSELLKTCPGYRPLICDKMYTNGLYLLLLDVPM